MKNLINYVSAAFLLAALTSTVSFSQSKIVRPAKTTNSEPNRSKDWQTIDLRSEGIKFKLPPGWKHDGSDLANKNETADAVMLEWNAPGGKHVRIYKATLLIGFLGSAKAMLAEDYRRRVADTFYHELKPLVLGSAKGIGYMIKIESEGEKRAGVIWKSFRTFEEKAQQIDITISGNVRDERLLKTILASFYVQDK